MGVGGRSTGLGDVARGAQGNQEDPSPAQGCDLPVLSQAHVTAPSLLGRLILSGHPPQARSALLRVFSVQHSVPKPSPMCWPRAPSMGSSEHGPPAAERRAGRTAASPYPASSTAFSAPTAAPPLSSPGPDFTSLKALSLHTGCLPLHPRHVRASLEPQSFQRSQPLVPRPPTSVPAWAMRSHAPVWRQGQETGPVSPLRT